MPTRGMVLGKFLPTHGHVYLCEFAQNYVDELDIVVDGESPGYVPGALRHAWMTELFPRANVLLLKDRNPQAPEEAPENFWDIWQASLLRLLPARPDYVFASESYGLKLAEVLGAEFVPVDMGRSAVPVSGTAVLADPMANWRHIPRCVRPYFAKRVCVFGPESTGKSTLAKKLGERFDTAVVPEYAQSFIAERNGVFRLEDVEGVARAQTASEDALARAANRALICDSDLLTTVIWSDRLFGSCPDWVRTEALRRAYDLYLLTDVDVPWVDDLHRLLPHDREGFMRTCEATLTAHGRAYVKISGSWENRFETAAAAVDALLRSPAPPVRRELLIRDASAS